MSDVRSVISTDRAPRSASPLSQGVRYGSFVFVSGQLGIDPSTKRKVPGGIAAETDQTLTNLRSVLEEAGTSLGNVVKTTCFLTDMADFAVFNQVYARFFPDGPPARSTVQVARLAGDYVVEVEAVACVGGSK